jgi:type I restriction enzyme M protein
MRKSLGSKRNELTNEHIEAIQKMYFAFEENQYSKIFDNEDFGFYQITVHHPQLDESGNVLMDKKGHPIENKELKDSENIPLKENIENYFRTEVLAFAPHAWYDQKKMKIGYEIPFTKYFYQFDNLRSLESIANDILLLEKETDGLLKEIVL